MFEKPQKCYFYRNSSCYLLYTTPAMGRILNILPAPLMEIWCGVIWVLIWINQIYLLVLSDVTRPGSCRLFCFLCSCHVPVLELLKSRAMWGAALSVPPAGLSLSPELLLQGEMQWEGLSNGEMLGLCRRDRDAFVLVQCPVINPCVLPPVPCVQ